MSKQLFSLIFALSTLSAQQATASWPTPQGVTRLYSDFEQNYPPSPENDDPNGDGVGHFRAYTLMRDPAENLFEVGKVRDEGTVADTITFKFFFDVRAIDACFRLEKSRNLINWNEVPVFEIKLGFASAHLLYPETFPADALDMYEVQISTEYTEGFYRIRYFVTEPVPESCRYRAAKP